MDVDTATTPETPQAPEAEADTADVTAEEEQAAEQKTGKGKKTPKSGKGKKAAQPPKQEVPLPEDFSQRLEAALLTTDKAMPAGKLAEVLGTQDSGGVKPVKQAIGELNAFYEKTDRSFRIEELAGGYQILTLPEYRDVLTALHRSRAQSKLSPAALETLAIVAYRQPLLRAEIETIRGVACGEVLRSLMERRLVKIVGRSEELGRPMLYGTTKSFLEVFGLASLKDLPKTDQLQRPEPPAPAAETVESEEEAEKEAGADAAEDTEATNQAELKNQAGVKNQAADEASPVQQASPTTADKEAGVAGDGGDADKA